MERAYDLIEVSQLLGLKVRTVRQWVHDGKLKAFKVGASPKWVVRESEIKRLRGEENADKN